MGNSHSSVGHGMVTGNGWGREEHVIYRLEKSRELLEWLSGELARRDGRPFTQLARVCELVNLAVTRVDFHEDLGMAWILLEQARQQLGHAATAVGTIDQQSRPNEGTLEGTVEGTVDSAVEVDPEATVWAQLVWFLQRDRTPWPENASEVVDFGGGPDLLPDFRPDTPLELVPLQLLAHAAMTFRAGEAVQDLDNRVMAMAFGEYVWTIMDEAMELLELHGGGEDSGDESGNDGGASLTECISTGQQVADLIGGAFPPAWQVFHGPAGFPDLSE